MNKRLRFWALSFVFVLFGLWTVATSSMSTASSNNYDGMWVLTLTGDNGTLFNYEISINNGEIITLIEEVSGNSLAGFNASVKETGGQGVQIVVSEQNAEFSYNLTFTGQWLSDKTMVSGNYSGACQSGARYATVNGTFFMKPLFNQPNPYISPGGNTAPDNTANNPPPTLGNPFGPPSTPDVPTDNSNRAFQIRVVKNKKQVNLVSTGEIFNLEVKVQLPSETSGGITVGASADPYVSIYSANEKWEVFLVTDQFENINISANKAPIVSNWSANTFEWDTLTEFYIPKESRYIGSYEFRGWIVPAGQDITGVSPSVFNLTVQGTSSSSGGIPTPILTPTPTPTPVPTRGKFPPAMPIFYPSY